jgi:hypothetical protein
MESHGLSQCAPSGLHHGPPGSPTRRLSVGCRRKKRDCIFLLLPNVGNDTLEFLPHFLSGPAWNREEARVAEWWCVRDASGVRESGPTTISIAIGQSPRWMLSSHQMF